MKYISIDIETTGLDPENNQILSIGAIIEDTNNILPLESIPTFHAAIIRENVTGSLVALNMNNKLIETIVQYSNLKTDESKINFSESKGLNFYKEDEIVQIIECEEEDTIDISVGNSTRLFFANNLLTHNSGFGASGRLNLSNIAESSGLGHTVDWMGGIIQDEIMYANNEYLLQTMLNRNEGYKNSRKKFNINYDYMRITEDAESEIILSATD